jgi:subfamily B ATP-binding cassette protein HlyB/CyaB
VTATTLPPTGLRFDNIDKRYGGLYALRRVSLEIAPGECVVLAGRNGSGKTTLLRIAAQIVLPTAGKLMFPGAGANTSNGRPGYVGHSTMVYDELSAEENLVLFAKLQNVDNPAARAEDLLHQVGLFDRRDSLVRTFSRGMRQRIAIARALITDPRILILDEATSALDYESERIIQQNMKQIAKGRTVLVIAHRLSTVRTTDRIVTIERGRLVEDGTHDALIKTGGRYASLHRLQGGFHEVG